jgi:tRNA threonylcarbamoyladenosine biosynthesis protein TsaE
MLEKISRSPEETIEFGKKIGALLKEGDVIAFKGSMGAGKTTFTHGLAMGMGLGDEVYSPTFTLVNEYRGKMTLCHFDMYRIESAGDLETTGFYDYLSDGCVMAIEWSEKIIPFLPKNTIFITIEQIDENTRKITVEGDERFDFIGI